MTWVWDSRVSKFMTWYLMWDSTPKYITFDFYLWCLALSPSRFRTTHRSDGSWRNVWETLSRAPTSTQAISAVVCSSGSYLDCFLLPWYKKNTGLWSSIKCDALSLPNCITTSSKTDILQYTGRHGRTPTYKKHVFMESWLLCFLQPSASALRRAAKKQVIFLCSIILLRPRSQRAYSESLANLMRQKLLPVLTALLGWRNGARLAPELLRPMGSFGLSRSIAYATGLTTKEVHGFPLSTSATLLVSLFLSFKQIRKVDFYLCMLQTLRHWFTHDTNFYYFFGTGKAENPISRCTCAKLLAHDDHHHHRVLLLNISGSGHAWIQQDVTRSSQCPWEPTESLLRVAAVSLGTQP